MQGRYRLNSALAYRANRYSNSLMHTRRRYACDATAWKNWWLGADPIQNRNAMTGVGASGSLYYDAVMQDRPIALYKMSEGQRLPADTPYITNLLSLNQASCGDALGDMTGFSDYYFATGQITESQKISGQKAIMLTSTAANNYSGYGIGIWTSSAGLSGIPVVENETYTFSVSAYSSEISNFAVRIRFFNGPAPIFITSPPLQSMSKWSTSSMTIVAPKGATYAAIGIVSSATTAAGQVMYTDNWGIWKGSGGTWAAPGRPILGVQYNQKITQNFADSANIASALNAVYSGSAYGYTQPLVSGGNSAVTLKSGDSVAIPALELWTRSRDAHPFTYECWFNADENASGAVLLQPYVGSTPVNDNFVMLSNGRVSVKVSNGTPTLAATNFAYAVYDIPEPGMSHHLVVTYSDTEIKIYVDSVLVDTIKKKNFAWDFDATSLNIVGPTQGTLTLDSVALYRTELSQKAIQNHYITGRSTLGTDEIARRLGGIYFPVSDENASPPLEFDYPQDSLWPYYSKSNNVEIQGSKIGLKTLTSPDYIDDNVFFTDSAVQCLPGMKMLSDEQSETTAVNLIENSSFDIDNSPKDGTPDKWTLSNAAVTADANDSQAAVELQPSGYVEMQTATTIASYTGKVVVAFDARATSNTSVTVTLTVNGSTVLTKTASAYESYARRYLEFSVANATSLRLKITSNATAGNLVKIDNSQIELAAFNKYVDGWYKYTDATTLPNISQTTIASESGGSSIRVTNRDATARKFGVRTESLPVDPGEIIYIRSSAMKESAWTQANTFVEHAVDWRAADGTLILSEVNTGSAPSATQWTENSSVFVAPAGVAYFEAYIYARNTTANIALNRFCYFDNIYVNELSGEAAQYFVIEDLSRMTNAKSGSIGFKFKHLAMHNAVTQDFAIASINDGSQGVSIVKTHSGSHKIVLRHTYINSVGAVENYDQTIATSPSVGWKNILISWDGDTFSIYLDNVLVVDSYQTSVRGRFVVNAATELVIGAGIDGASGFGSSFKDVRIFDAAESSSVYFAGVYTKPGNYYLPLSSSLAIAQSGYAEFYFNLTSLYNSIDDARIEWGPNHPNIGVSGGLAENPATVMTSGTEPTPLGGGIVPSTGDGTYFVKVSFNSTDSIYDPALLSYLSLTFLDDVQFKSKGASLRLTPSGDYNVASRTSPIISKYFDNGVQFRAQTASKNRIFNGGFMYNLDGWCAANIPETPIESAHDALMPVARLYRNIDMFPPSGVSQSSCQAVTQRKGPIQLAAVGEYNDYRYPYVNSVSSLKRHFIPIAAGETAFASAWVYTTTQMSVRFRFIDYKNDKYFSSRASEYQVIPDHQWTQLNHVLPVRQHSASGIFVVETLEVPVGESLYVTDIQVEGTNFTPFENNVGSYMAVEDYVPQKAAVADATEPYIKFSSGNYASFIDQSIYDSSYLDLMIKVSMDDWSPASEIVLASNWHYQKSWKFSLMPSGQLKFTIYKNYGDSESQTIAPVPFADGEKGWVRAIFDGDYAQVKFGISRDGDAWTLLESDKAEVSASLNDSGHTYNINGIDGGTSMTGAFSLYRMKFNSRSMEIIDIDCSTMLNNNLQTINNSATPVRGFVSSVNSIVSLNGTFAESDIYVPYRVPSALPQKIKTVEFWIKPNEPAANDTSYFYASQPNRYASLLGLNPLAEYAMYVEDGLVRTKNLQAYINGRLMPNDYAFPVNEWTHVILRQTASELAGVAYGESLGEIRSNLVVNPTLIDGNSWSNVSSTTSTFNIDASAPMNKRAVELTWTSATPPTSGQFGLNTRCSVTPGKLTLSFFSKSAGSSRSMGIFISWRDTLDAEISTTSMVSAYTNSASDWTRFALTAEAPATAVAASITFAVTGAASNGEKHYISMPLIELGDALLPYFDGSDAECVWSGIPFNSPSIQNYGMVAAKTSNRTMVINGNAAFVSGASANYTNIAFYPVALTTAQILENYQMYMSRGTSTIVADSLRTPIAPGASAQQVISDVAPLVISQPWQTY